MYNYMLNQQKRLHIFRIVYKFNVISSIWILRISKRTSFNFICGLFSEYHKFVHIRAASIINCLSHIALRFSLGDLS